MLWMGVGGLVFVWSLGLGLPLLVSPGGVGLHLVVWLLSRTGLRSSRSDLGLAVA